MSPIMWFCVSFFECGFAFLFLKSIFIFTLCIQQVQQEVDDVIGQARVPSLTDRPFMPYTVATIMEIQRYRTVAPYLPPRMLYRDVEFHGYFLPKGTQIWVNLWAALNDPSEWTNPDSFDPTRFLSDDGKRVIVPEAFIPFGTGKLSTQISNDVLLVLIRGPCFIAYNKVCLLEHIFVICNFSPHI